MVRRGSCRWIFRIRRPTSTESLRRKRRRTATIRAFCEIKPAKGETATFTPVALEEADLKIEPIPVGEVDCNLYGLSKKTERLPGHAFYKKKVKQSNHMKNTSILSFTLAFAAVFVPAARAAGLVTIESLLHEMTDRDAVARFPECDFRLKEHTSYNRASVSPEDEQGWFANGDFNKGNSRNFIRIEENNGRKEWVMMDHQGAGAIVRSWQPFRAAPKNAILRIYLDGSDAPVIEGNPCTLFNGEGLVPYPFAHKSLLSAVSFFPIPYAKSCKVTMSELPYFFIFTFREYAAGTEVKTFTMADFEAAKALTEKVGKSLLTPVARGAGSPLGFSAKLEKDQEKSVALPAGMAAVRELTVKLASYDDPNVMRKVVLKMGFDGKETVWCPIGDFFGSGIGLNPHQAWSFSMAEDGTMTCRWVMPYKEGGKVSLVNFGDEAVDAVLEVKTGEWKWDDRSMYFHANWRGQYPVPTMPRSDWNYITTKGRGVYVGDTLTIMNPVKGWWGEGDAKIWVDGEKFPSMFGTGTEDYYAYSWGGVSTDFYEHPFHGQPFCHKYNKLYRKTENGERNCQGFSVETRTRALDTMPFGSSLQLDMEVWSGTDCGMGYQVGTYWYGFAETTSNRKAEPAEVLNVPLLPDPNEAQPAKAQKISFENALEIETLKVLSHPDTMIFKPQKLNGQNGTWNENDHVLIRGGKTGDVLEFRIPTESPVAERLILNATKAPDFGILKISVNSKEAVKELDLYSAKVASTGTIELGVFDPAESQYVLRIEIVGQNPKSKGTLFGLDSIRLETAQ